MRAKEIPDFIESVMEQIEEGVNRVAQKKLHPVEPPSGVDPVGVFVTYPDVVEIMLNVDAKCDDGTEAGYYESQTIWVKVPWPQRIG